ncbi:uncharacterized protein BBA_09967 [Beauveria bassiana ARSEF 2860]|uniref:Uncharacterized protein n=1 Tax=Beauveria bassiana (strain ARSEF 2860) TaxID=655819 RepID=J4VR08_BEAB2|nr:uncharacterized protein BBA_09967 [Beauveria bassiana ARSEF 2860]EJP61100.1 hypothetical protein BBA_09967 [Beauveria bassiana ARSEF 2860]
MTAISTHDQHVSSTATAARQERDIAPATCSKLVEHEDRPPALALTSRHPSQSPAYEATGEGPNEAILISTDSESESMSESDGETDDDVPSLKTMNGRIDKETTTQPNTSSASTATVPNTPRDVSLSPEGDDDLDGAVQCSRSAFPNTSPPPRQAFRDGSDSSRRSSSIPAEVAEQGYGQAEDADESLSSHRDNREPSCRAELPRQTQPHEGAIHNDSASIDGDGNIADHGDSDSSSRDGDSDSSSDSDGGNDGDDDDYNDDGSPSDTDGEDDGHSKKRSANQSPSVTSSEDGHADSLSDDNMAVKTLRPHKRQKVAHEGAGMTPVRSPNHMPRSGGPPLLSPRRAQTAGMLSPPASHSLSESESENGSDCSKASSASFGEWQLQNAALKCVTIDGITTFQLQFQRVQPHSCSSRRQRRPHKLVKSKARGRKSRDETKGRRCGMCEYLVRTAAHSCGGPTKRSRA